MIVAGLPEAELARRLAGPGLRLRTGPVVTEIRSSLPTIAEGMALLYAEHPVEDAAGFADFHVRIARPPSVRRWLRPQVLFELDGNPPFHPLPAGQAFPILEWGPGWSLAQWAALIRDARAANLLGRLATFLDDKGMLGQVPRAPRAHLQAARVAARGRHFRTSTSWCPGKRWQRSKPR